MRKNTIRELLRWLACDTLLATECPLPFLNMLLQVVIEPNASVCQTAQIALAASDSAGDEGSTETALIIKLTIGTGNIFHPNARVHIVPPTGINIFDPENQQEMFISIGANNIFEEESSLAFDLSDIPFGKYSDEKSGMTLLGSYNQILASSHIQCTSIGNANIFHAKCNITTDEIKNGNIFQAYSLLHRENSVNIDLQEKILYNVGDCDVSKIRNHSNGIQKNISDGSLLLRATRKIIVQHHRLMACKTDEKSTNSNK